MRAVLCTTPGSVRDLTVATMSPLPLPDNGARVMVEAAGVNYVDALFVEGRYQIKPNPPFTPGSEVAGRIGEVGSEWSGPAVGTRVLVSCGMGGYATEVIARPGQAVPIPEQLSAPAAACFTQSYATALFALRTRAHLVGGERVLVLGGGGGVGLAAIQVATALGATVIAQGSTEEKRDAARRAGASITIGGDATTLKDDVRGSLDGGVDVVIDPVGGAFTGQALRTLRDGGRLAVIGFVAGPIPEIPTNQILLRNRSVVGVDWGIWAMTNPAAQVALLGELLAMVEAGSLTPAEPTLFSLDDAALALLALQERRVVGKIALSVSE